MSLSILLADDSAIVRKILKKELPEVFKGKEIDFTEAANGREALEHLEKTGFDLVFLDLTMPEKTGYEVLEAARDRCIITPIVVLTADIQPEAERIVTSLGAIGYMEKKRPLDLTPLTNILKKTGML